MGTTEDWNDPALHNINERGMQEKYLVLPQEARADQIRPYRTTYQHLTCGSNTTMGKAIAQTWAANPHFYGGTYCVTCGHHFPVHEFVWTDAFGRPTSDRLGE